MANIDTWTYHKVRSNYELKSYLESFGLNLKGSWALIYEQSSSRVREAWRFYGDGSMNIKHEEKCTLIKDFSKNFTVLSEVGSKNENIELSEDLWINYINNEIDAGSWKVITEAREGGNIGIFQSDCSINENLINNISKNIKPSKILWEAPQKDQQVWFINNFGSNVNLGNISPNEILSLECLRLGLRGDTFSNYL